MTKNEYNGWHNYETWVVALWMDNEQGSYDYWRERTQEVYEQEDKDKDDTICALADALQEHHEELLPKVEGFAADLLGAAMSEVNWYEIAEHLVADNIDEEETASNASS